MSAIAPIRATMNPTPAAENPVMNAGMAKALEMPKYASAMQIPDRMSPRAQLRYLNDGQPDAVVDRRVRSPWRVR